MKKSLLMLLGICFAIFGSSCATQPPDLEPCVIVSETKARCIPQNPSKKEYDKDISEMIGDITLTAEEVAELKKWIKSVLEDLRFNQVEEIANFHRNVNRSSVPGEGNGR